MWFRFTERLNSAYWPSQMQEIWSCRWLPYRSRRRRLKYRISRKIGEIWQPYGIIIGRQSEVLSGTSSVKLCVKLRNVEFFHSWQLCGSRDELSPRKKRGRRQLFCPVGCFDLALGKMLLDRSVAARPPAWETADPVPRPSPRR